jgi:hypothetical protein
LSAHDAATPMAHRELFKIRSMLQLALVLLPKTSI